MLTAEEIKAILAKYIAHVGDCEGVDFLAPRHECWFTAEEWAVLQECRG